MRRPAQVLQAQGQTLVSPEDRAGLHPLLIPLAQQQPGPDQAGPTVTCLLRWPEPAIKKVRNRRARPAACLLPADQPVAQAQAG